MNVQVNDLSTGKSISFHPCAIIAGAACTLPVRAGFYAGVGALTAVALSHPLGAAGGALGGAIGGSVDHLVDTGYYLINVDPQNKMAGVAKQIANFALSIIGMVGGYLAAGAIMGKTVTLASAALLTFAPMAVGAAIALPVICCLGATLAGGCLIANR